MRRNRCYLHWGSLLGDRARGRRGKTNGAGADMRSAPREEPIEPAAHGACRVPWGALFSHWRAGFSTRPGGFVDSGAPPRIIQGDHRRPAEETGSLKAGAEGATAP